MHCIGLAILSHLSQFPFRISHNWPFCVDVPLNTNQSINYFWLLLNTSTRGIALLWDALTGRLSHVIWNFKWMFAGVIWPALDNKQQLFECTKAYAEIVVFHTFDQHSDLEDGIPSKNILPWLRLCYTLSNCISHIQPFLKLSCLKLTCLPQSRKPSEIHVNVLASVFRTYVWTTLLLKVMIKNLTAQFYHLKVCIVFFFWFPKLKKGGQVMGVYVNVIGNPSQYILAVHWSYFDISNSFLNETFK